MIYISNEYNRSIIKINKWKMLVERSKRKKKNSLSAKSFYGNEPFHFRSHIVRARSHFFSSLLEQISWHVGDRRLKRECCARPVIGISKFPIKIRIVYRALCCDARVPRSRGSCCSNTRDTVRSRRNISDNQRKIARPNESPALLINYHFPVDCIVYACRYRR